MFFPAFDPFSAVFGAARGGQGKAHAERLADEARLNTALTYEYMDLNSYQTSRRVVFVGEFDSKDIKKLIKKMKRNWADHFLPELVGLEDIRHELAINYPTTTFPGERDTAFHELMLPSMLETTQDAPTDIRTWRQFMETFLAVSDDIN